MLFARVDKMQAFVDQPVIPGDVVGSIAGIAEAVRLGPGLTQNGESITATKAGILRHRAPDKYWIENSQKRVRGALFIALFPPIVPSTRRQSRLKWFQRDIEVLFFLSLFDVSALQHHWKRFSVSFTSNEPFLLLLNFLVHASDRWCCYWNCYRASRRGLQGWYRHKPALDAFHLSIRRRNQEKSS